MRCDRVVNRALTELWCSHPGGTLHCDSVVGNLTYAVTK